MTKAPRTGVVYPNLGADGRPLTVERLRHHDINMVTAARIQRVMQPAYIAQFEATGMLPEGTVTEHAFDPASKKKVRTQQGRMSSHTQKYHAQYWFIRDPEDDKELVGLAKVMPKGLEDDTPFGYFNDVVVRPDAQGNGYGRVLAHASLKFGPAPQNQPLALEGYAGSPVNAWFEGEWHMVARGVDADGVSFGQHKLPQIRYITEADISVAGIVRGFEARIPELALGEYVEL